VLVRHFEKTWEKLVRSSKFARDVISREADFMFTYFNMDDYENSGRNTNEWQEIQPYMFEPNKNEGTNESYDSGDESTSTEEEEEEIDHEFEAINSWRLSTLEWCKCGHCAIMEKSIESFCCHEKAVEYDEYDGKLTCAQDQGLTCITELSAFTQNMLSEEVLEIDASQYLEDNWPIGDDELAQTHKIYRLVSYRRCSRWIFHILGKKNRRVFPSCVYKSIRNKFASPDGLYTHFKFAK
jgi:hypothetical protein